MQSAFITSLGVLGSDGCVLLKGLFKFDLFAEFLDDFGVCSESESTQKNGHRNLTGPVDTHIEYIVGIGLILKPCTTVRDNLA